jgi:molybdopterin-guanine dinucleotide biosynthesis protein A
MSTLVSTTSSGTSVAVLGGGASSRFGSDKAQAMVDGRPMISWVLERFLPVTDDAFVQLPPEGRAPQGVRSMRDVIPGRGPLSGVHGALANAQHPWVLVVACDMPGVDPALASVLGRHVAEGVEAIVPSWRGGHIEPLGALYSRALLPRAEALLSEGACRPSMLLAPPTRVRYVPIEPLLSSGGLCADCFVNVNTKGELARWATSKGPAGTVISGRRA